MHRCSGLYNKYYHQVVIRRLIVERTQEMKTRLVDFSEAMKGRAYEENTSEIIKAVLGIQQVV